MINAETQQGLSGVVFKICDYEISSSTDGDGHAFIELVPGIAFNDVYVTFERSGFGAFAVHVPINTDSGVFEGALQERHFIDIGTVTMRPSQSVTAHVTRDGSPLPNAVLYARENLSQVQVFQYDGTSECTDLNIVGTTNSSGVATMNGFDPTRYYMFVVPSQDLDGDSLPDIYTAISGLRIVDDGDTIGINTQTLLPDTGPEITGSNAAHFRSGYSLNTFTINGAAGFFGTENVNIFESIVTGNGSVQLVFWNPVEITDANFRYRNNLVDPADPSFNDDLRINATTVELAGSDATIFNFIPTTPLPSNEVVTLNFIARSLVDPTSSGNLSRDFYVPLHLGSIPFGIDNYNGSVDGSGGSDFTYLRFPEFVEGFYKVLEFHPNASSTTFENPFPWGLDSSIHEIVNNQVPAPISGNNNFGGTVAGKQYRARLLTPSSSLLSMNDNTPTATNTVTIELSVRNIIGVTLDGIFTVPVE